MIFLLNILIFQEISASYHNCFSLVDEKSNMQKVHIANSDKLVAFYNLDVIISVGYRVKSKQGTQFRIWATTILREYLLKGYAINQRVDRIENNLEDLSKEVGAKRVRTGRLLLKKVFFASFNNFTAFNI